MSLDPYLDFFVNIYRPDSTFRLKVEIRSKSQEGKTYTISQRHGSKKLECSCPHYLFRLRSKGVKCKHIIEYESLAGGNEVCQN